MGNRNLYGFALFAFIIVATVLVKYAFFTPVKPVNQKNVSVQTTSERYVCNQWAKKPAASPFIEQAVLSQKNKTVKIELNSSGLSERNGKDRLIGATFVFFVKDSQTRKIAEETSDINQIIVGSREVEQVELNVAWANQIKHGQTLYVAPRISPARNSDGSKNFVNFNEADAVPVLIINK